MNKYSHIRFSSSPWLHHKSDTFSTFITEKEIKKPITVIRRTLSNAKFDNSIIDKINNDSTNISERENQRALRKSESINRMDLKALQDPGTISLKPLEFNKLIKELDKVINNANYGQRRVILEEGKLNYVHLEEGESQLFTIFSENKPIPLKIKIERKIGKKTLTTYVSRKVQFPDSDQHDAVYTRDEFDISDIGLQELNFVTQRICLNITSNETCSFIIGINFGRIISKEACELFRKRDKEEEYLNQANKNIPVYLEEDSLDRKLKKQDIVMRSINFVKRNIQRAQSCQRLNDFVTEKRDISESRRRNAVSRHHEILAERRIRGEIFIKKNEIRKSLNHQVEKVYKIHHAKHEFGKRWLSLMYFCKSILILREKLEKRKSIAKANIRSLFAVIAFQHTWKKYIKRAPVKDLNMRRARNALLLYGANGKNFMIAKAKRQILIAAYHSSINFKLPGYFINFLSKILLIQSAWKTYQKTKNKRFKKINHMWNQTIDSIVKKVMNKKRKTKKSKTIINKLINIPHESKKSLISLYLQNVMKSYIETIRDPAETEKIVEKNSRKNSKSHSRKSSRYGTRVNLKYIPSQQDVLGMIKSAAYIDSPLKI